MLTGPNHVFAFVCQQTGRCCSSRWKVELSHYDQVNLAAKARGTDLERAVAEQVIPDELPEGAESEGEAMSGDDYRRTYHLAKSACGSCSFLDGTRCSIHAVVGPSALPDPCRNFPVIAVQTSWGVEVGYNLACPHAIALTAKDPFVLEKQEQWERPLDPQQSKASFIPPPEGWRAWRAKRQGAIEALAEPEPDSPDAALAAAAIALNLLVPDAAYTPASLAAWGNALTLESRIADCVADCAPFLGTWGAPLEQAPAWHSIEAGLELAAASAGGLALVLRYLQHTIHTVYFRTGLPSAHAYQLALAAFASVCRLAPAMAEAYPKAPLRAAIVLVEMGLFADLRSLASAELPALPAPAGVV